MEQNIESKALLRIKERLVIDQNLISIPDIVRIRVISKLESSWDPSSIEVFPLVSYRELPDDRIFRVKCIGNKDVFGYIFPCRSLLAVDMAAPSGYSTAEAKNISACALHAIQYLMNQNWGPEDLSLQDYESLVDYIQGEVFTEDIFEQIFGSTTCVFVVNKYCFESNMGPLPNFHLFLPSLMQYGFYFSDSPVQRLRIVDRIFGNNEIHYFNSIIPRDNSAIKIKISTSQLLKSDYFKILLDSTLTKNIDPIVRFLACYQVFEVLIYKGRIQKLKEQLGILDKEKENYLSVESLAKEVDFYDKFTKIVAKPTESSLLSELLNSVKDPFISLPELNRLVLRVIEAGQDSVLEPSTHVYQFRNRIVHRLRGFVIDDDFTTSVFWLELCALETLLLDEIQK